MKTSLVLATSALLLTSACSGSSTKDTSDTSLPSSPSEPTAASTTAAADDSPLITIKGFRYTPVQVAPGTTITVKNLDDVEHTVTSDTKGEFDAAEIGGTPKTFTAPTKPGAYNFHCTYHASMHGQLIVT